MNKENLTEKRGLLIIDDEPDILESLEGMFRKHYNVKTCNSAQDAFRLLRKEPKRFSVVITDERMPQITGHEFLTMLREWNDDIVGILFTGFTDMAALVKAVNDGRIFGCHFKGSEPDELKQLVEKAFVLVDEQDETKKNQYFDMLTGLRTGSVLRDMLNKELDRCRRYGHRFACVMVNLRDLHMINDLYEIDMEDMIVAGVAAALHEKIRGSDYIGRLSKDTFLAVLVGTNAEGATIFQERCLNILHEIHVPDKDSISLEVAVSNVALTAEDDLSVELLLQRLEKELDVKIESEFEQY